jgi:hypothetical protein
MKAHYIPNMSDFNCRSISARTLLTHVYTILEEVKNVQTTTVNIKNREKNTSFFIFLKCSQRKLGADFKQLS